MKQIDNLLIADEGYFLRKIGERDIVGKEYLCGYIYYDKNGNKLDVPHLENEYDFEEISIDSVYGELVTKLIREKYSISDELAIQRQRDTKPEDFAEYNTFCEECKAKAKKELNL